MNARPVCTLCDAELDDPGCTPGARFVDAAGVEHARWAHGAEPGSPDEIAPCVGCGAGTYQFHHDPCTEDQCPHGPWIDCVAGCRLALVGELAP